MKEQSSSDEEGENWKQKQEALEQKVNDFRNGLVLKVQIMCRTEEPKEEILRVVRELEDSWIEICDSLGVDEDVVPFSFDNLKEWTSEWYQKISWIRRKIANCHQPAKKVSISNISEIQEEEEDSDDTTGENYELEMNGTEISSLLPKVEIKDNNDRFANLNQALEKSKEYLNFIRNQCIQTSLSLIKEKAERDNIILEYDLIGLRKSSLTEEQLLRKSLELIDQIKEKYVTELNQMNAAREKVEQEKRHYSNLVLNVGNLASPAKIDFAKNIKASPSFQLIHSPTISQQISSKNIKSEINEHSEKNKDQKTKAEEAQKLAQKRAMEKNRRKKEEEEAQKLKDLEKAKKLEMLKEKQRKKLEKEKALIRSRENLLQMISEELPDIEQDDQKKDEKQILEKLSIDESRKRAAQRAKEAKKREEERKLKELEEQEKKKAAIFKKRDERLSKFKIEYEQKAQREKSKPEKEGHYSNYAQESCDNSTDTDRFTLNAPDYFLFDNQSSKLELSPYPTTEKNEAVNASSSLLKKPSILDDSLLF